MCIKPPRCIITSNSSKVKAPLHVDYTLVHLIGSNWPQLLYTVQPKYRNIEAKFSNKESVKCNSFLLYYLVGTLTDLDYKVPARLLPMMLNTSRYLPPPILFKWLDQASPIQGLKVIQVPRLRGNIQCNIH